MIERGSAYFIARDEGLYLSRYFLLRMKALGIFLHRFWTSDPQGSDGSRFHCHPWHNISIVLAGGYWENQIDGTRQWRYPGSVVFRSAEAFHWIELPDEMRGKTLTIFIRFRRYRDWGFLDPSVWKKHESSASESQLNGIFFPRRKSAAK
jgi:hypothetical protein